MFMLDEIEVLLFVVCGYWVVVGIFEVLFDNVFFSVVMLFFGVVGQEFGLQIQLFVNGGGWGWFVDVILE